MSKTMGIIVNREKEGAVQYARGVIQWLEKKENRVLVTNWLGNRIHRHDLVADKSEMGEISDLVISLGGMELFAEQPGILPLMRSPFWASILGD